VKIHFGLITPVLLELYAEEDFSRKTIIRNFNSLVDKEDYAKNKKKGIIERLAEISKCG
jgi:hypothetical protein